MILNFVQLIKIQNFEEFNDIKRNNFEDRLKTEFLLKKEFNQSLNDTIVGYCKFCERPSKFKIHKRKNGKIFFRDTLVCDFCKLGNRKRFMANYLKNLANDQDLKLSVFAYEQITKFFKSAKSIKNISLTGSEFLGYDKKPGVKIGGVRHEDAMNLSFPDNSFDVIISNDVFEHVPDIQKTLNESYRVLKTSGLLLVSIPFNFNKTETVTRAILDNGEVKHLLPPTYHANPVAIEKGSLVFYDYGWDFLNFLKNSGFSDSYMLGYYDIFYGHIGAGLQYIFVGQK